ncbi:MAG: glycosyltransferase, partial [Miltoncostaeaceae bacterium]
MPRPLPPSPFTIAAAAAAVCWAGVLAHPARAWRLVPRDEKVEPWDETWPTVGVVVPARNEAEMLSSTLPALLGQRYPGGMRVVVVDDRSDDGTDDVARSVGGGAVTVVGGAALPSGWVGKVWALHQGVEHLSSGPSPPDYILATDADILHAPDSLRRLVADARAGDLDLASRMARLRCRSGAEQLLIPPFVLFFNLLYPMRWANRRGARTAAAAGGCMLLRRGALDRAGGYPAIRSSLIDDLALARTIKRSGGKTRLAVSTGRVSSLRAYDDVGAVWRMVRRSAYTQLRRSPALLAAVTVVMGVMFAGPPVGVLAGLRLAVAGRPSRAWAPPLVAGAAGWAMSAAAAAPAVRLHG